MSMICIIYIYMDFCCFFKDYVFMYYVYTCFLYIIKCICVIDMGLAIDVDCYHQLLRSTGYF